MDFLPLLSRWIHILAATAAIGGPIFVLVALLPASSTLSEPDRAALQDGIRRRWSKVVMAAIGFLLLSGFYNYWVIHTTSQQWSDAWHHGGESSRLYNMLFGIKVLLAFGVFFIASALSGRSPAFANLRAQAGSWLKIQLVLSVLIVMIAGQMRAMHAGPNVAPPSTTTTQ